MSELERIVKEVKEVLRKRKIYAKQEFIECLKDGHTVHAHYLGGIRDGLNEAYDVVTKLEHELTLDEVGD